MIPHGNATCGQDTAYDSYGLDTRVFPTGPRLTSGLAQHLGIDPRLRLIMASTTNAVIRRTGTGCCAR